MSDAMTELKKELKISLALLQTLRDEVRAKLHLAGVDAKESVKEVWKELEVQILAAEKSVAIAATEATRAAVNESIKRLEAFSASLHG
jgi:hypothetical protein